MNILPPITPQSLFLPEDKVHFKAREGIRNGVVQEGSKKYPYNQFDVIVVTGQTYTIVHVDELFHGWI